MVGNKDKILISLINDCKWKEVYVIKWGFLDLKFKLND